MLSNPKFKGERVRPSRFITGLLKDGVTGMGVRGKVTVGGATSWGAVGTGEFKLQLPVNAQSATVLASGYSEILLPLGAVPDGQTDLGVIDLVPTGSISIRVVGEDGVPPAGGSSPAVFPHNGYSLPRSFSKVRLGNPAYVSRFARMGVTEFKP